jgi:hypothetical protein
LEHGIGEKGGDEDRDDHHSRMPAGHPETQPGEPSGEQHYCEGNLCERCRLHDEAGLRESRHVEIGAPEERESVDHEDAECAEQKRPADDARGAETLLSCAHWGGRRL